MDSPLEEAIKMANIEEDVVFVDTQITDNPQLFVLPDVKVVIEDYQMEEDAEKVSEQSSLKKEGEEIVIKDTEQHCIESGISGKNEVTDQYISMAGKESTIKSEVEVTEQLKSADSETEAFIKNEVVDIEKVVVVTEEDEYKSALVEKQATIVNIGEEGVESIIAEESKATVKDIKQHNADEVAENAFINEMGLDVEETKKIEEDLLAEDDDEARKTFVEIFYVDPTIRRPTQPAPLAGGSKPMGGGSCSGSAASYKDGMGNTFNFTEESAMKKRRTLPNDKRIKIPSVDAKKTAKSCNKELSRSSSSSSRQAILLENRPVAMKDKHFLVLNSASFTADKL